MHNLRVVPATRNIRFLKEEQKPLQTEARVFSALNRVFERENRIPTVVRSVVIRLIQSKLLVTGLLCLFGFLTTESKDKKFLATLSIVINAVAFIHYSAILKVRDQSGMPTWLRFQGPQQVKSVPLDSEANFEPLEATEKLQLQEMAVDVLRHSDWLVTLPFLTFKLYTIFGRVGFLVHKEWAILLLFLMVLFGLVTRVGTDELSPSPYVNGKRVGTSRETCVLFLGLVSYLAAIACMVVVLVDMVEASEGIPENATLRSFFLVWCGYPVVGIIAIVSRQAYPDKGATGYSEALSLFKDVGFGALDVYSKAFFALFTAYSAFEKPLAGSIPISEPYVWNTTAS